MNFTRLMNGGLNNTWLAILPSLLTHEQTTYVPALLLPGCSNHFYLAQSPSTAYSPKKFQASPHASIYLLKFYIQTPLHTLWCFVWTLPSAPSSAWESALRPRALAPGSGARTATWGRFSIFLSPVFKLDIPLLGFSWPSSLPSLFSSSILMVHLC